MAGFVQNLLTDAATSFFTNEYLRDYQHASKTFRTNAYGYSPKFKFLFHVYFDINKDYIGATQGWPQDQNQVNCHASPAACHAWRGSLRQ